MTVMAEAGPALSSPAVGIVLPADVRRIAARVARTRHLLVICDYAAVVAARRRLLVVLRELARLDSSTAAIVSHDDHGYLGDIAPSVAFQILGGEVIAFPDVPPGHALAAARSLTGATTAARIRYRPSPVDAPVAHVGTALVEFTVPSVAALEALLAILRDERRDWLRRESDSPIEGLTLLADGASVALLRPDARLTWLCHPHPDSDPVFADLLGGASAGHFSIQPAGRSGPPEQRYLPGTMTVETRWDDMTVTDYLDCPSTAGRTDLVRVITGVGRVTVAFAPRPGFGRVPVRLRSRAGGLVVLDGPYPIALRSPGLSWTITSSGGQPEARATVRLAEGQPAVLELRSGTDDLSASPVLETARRDRSGRSWSDWVSALALPAVAPELVTRSALTLRALWYARTGAFLAAATTSLPEELGGSRNWDYRYCWVRDAALSARELVGLGSTAEAAGFLDWLRTVLAASAGPDNLRPLYTVTGEALCPETVIDTLPGYRNSRPVRVGNLAELQLQLDVFGPVAELVTALSQARGALADPDWRLVHDLAEAVARRWREPDHGIWEERTRPRHYVYSKVMCWVTLDRALTLAARYRREPGSQWAAMRDLLADEILSKGWQHQTAAGVGAFTAAYGSADIDAAALHVGLSGLVDAGDPRFASTITAVERQLRRGPVVYRYRRDDALQGEEAGFHLCTAWLIEAYLLSGRPDAPEELFGQLIAAAGPTGLLPEEYDPLTGAGLGNHPQAYSHLSLIRIARLLDKRLLSERDLVPACRRETSHVWRAHRGGTGPATGNPLLGHREGPRPGPPGAGQRRLAGLLPAGSRGGGGLVPPGSRRAARQAGDIARVHPHRGARRAPP